MTFSELVQLTFGDRFFVHKHLEECYAEAFNLANSLEPEQYVEVIGPSGACKSTLRVLLARSLVPPVDEWPIGSVPILSIRASNPSDGFYDSKDFHSRMLYLLGDPFRGCRVSEPTGASIDEIDDEVARIVKSAAWQKIHLSHSETEIRRTLERVAIARGLKFLLVDEAHVMGLVKRNREGVSHLESLRAFAELVGCKLILFGTYYLLDVWKRSGELNRRLAKVHLRRYKDTDPAELQEFARCVSLLAGSYKFETIDFIKVNIALIYNLTLGIIGEVHDLFERSSIFARTLRRETISESDLMAKAHAQIQLWTMYQEALLGEERMVQPTDTFLKTLFYARRDINFFSQNAEAERGGTNRKPGRRNPGRDPVGGNWS